MKIGTYHKKTKPVGFLRRIAINRQRKKAFTKLHQAFFDLSLEEESRFYRPGGGNIAENPRVRRRLRSKAQKQATRLSNNLDKLPGTDEEKVELLRTVVENPNLIKSPGGFKYPPPNFWKLAVKHQVPAKQVPQFIDKVSKTFHAAEKAGVSRSRVLSQIPKEPLGAQAASIISQTATKLSGQKRDKSEVKQKRKQLALTEGKRRDKKSSWGDVSDSKLALIHLTNYMPENGILYPPGHYIKTGVGNVRDTLHFSLNGPVGSHAYDWSGREIAIYVPYGKAKHWIYNAHPVDTFGIGPLKLPEGSHVLVSKETAQKEGLEQGQKLRGAKVTIVDVQRHRKKLFSRGLLDKNTLEGFYQHRIADFARERWEKEGRPGDFEEFKRNLLNYTLQDNNPEFDPSVFAEAGKHLGISKEYQDRRNLREGLRDTVSKNPKPICDFYGINKIPESLGEAHIESSFHNAINDFLKKRGVPVRGVGMWDWAEGAEGLSEKFRKDGFRSQAPHSSTDIYELESGILDTNYLLKKVEKAKSLVRDGRGGKRQARLIQNLGKRIMADIESKKANNKGES